MGRYLCSTSEKSKYWLNWSACGIFTCVVIHFIFVASNIVTNLYSIPKCIESFPKRVIIISIFELFAVLAQWSHIMCVFTDPGSVPCDSIPLSTATDDERMRVCLKCERNSESQNSCFKPPRAHHCSECGRCIVRMDHHCPLLINKDIIYSWINNCVGIANTKFFIQFLVYTWLYCMIAVIISVSFFIRRMTIESEDNFRIMKCDISVLEMGLVGLVLLIGFFFVIFTTTMFTDIIQVIKSGIAIDVLKGIKYDEPIRNSLIDVFGGKGTFSLNWLLPINPIFQDRDDILQYRRGDNESFVVVTGDEKVDGDWHFKREKETV